MRFPPSKPAHAKAFPPIMPHSSRISDLSQFLAGTAGAEEEEARESNLVFLILYAGREKAPEGRIKARPPKDSIKVPRATCSHIRSSTFLDGRLLRSFAQASQSLWPRWRSGSKLQTAWVRPQSPERSQPAKSFKFAPLLMQRLPALS
ncbi:unnamed protein product [Symbiodinium natans]|uniref:Uncharacterized protein n=1 Tax=Symbiodinium natans TaxID=878477 RepID=A0A812SH77_9DINO|nr:unnamed protein product [Symbiodinium natans]